MKKILFVDCSQAHGGAQRSLYTLITHLDEGRYKPHLLCGNDSLQGLLKQCRKVGIHAGYVAIRSWRRNLQGVHHAVVDMMKAKPVITRWMEKYEIDLVYANGLQSGLLCSLVIPKTTPLIFHHRDYKGPAQAIAKVLKRADQTIMVSDFLLDHCRATYPELAERLHRVYNGFDFEQMTRLRRQYDYREQRGMARDTFVVSMLADLIPWKRQDLFLRAFAKLRERLPDAFAFVIGGPRDEAGEAYEVELLALAEELKLTQHVAFTGHVDNPFPLIDASSVIVSTAEHEPFGRGIVESLFCGRPLVVTPGGGPAEIGRGCPALVEAEATPEALAEAIAAWAALTPEKRQEIADAATHRAREFALSSYVDGVAAIIDTLGS